MIIQDHAAFAKALPDAALPPLAPPLAGASAAPGRCMLLRADALGAADEQRWDELGENAEGTSVFSQPWFARAGLAHCRGGAQARLAVVRGEGGEWLGVLPLVTRLRYGKAPFPHWAGWTHANQFRGSPLIRRGHAADFWRALLAGLDRQGFPRMALRLTGLPLGEETTIALLQVVCEQGRAFKIDSQVSRAVLLPDAPEDPEGLKGSRRRRIASLERKVERELGPLGWRVVRGGTDWDAALGRFLALEAAGWKGAAGSALASAEETARFFAAITAAAAARDRVEITELLAGDRVIASSIHFTGRDEGFGYKMAYDESLGAYGPGLLLLHRLTAHFRETSMARIDSCCAPGQEPIGSLWADRMTLVDCGVALGAGSGIGLRRRALGLLDIAEAVYRGRPA